MINIFLGYHLIQKNMEKGERDDSDTRIVSIIVKNKPTLFDIKNHLLSLQKRMCRL
jgi:hypothetical protein